jgi:hypothetical protein
MARKKKRMRRGRRRVVARKRRARSRRARRLRHTGHGNAIINRPIPIQRLLLPRRHTFVMPWFERYFCAVDGADSTNIMKRVWVLNRPGSNVEDGAEELIADAHEQDMINATGSWGLEHQPFGWDQIVNDYNEYRISHVKFTLKVWRHKEQITNGTSGKQHNEYENVNIAWFVSPVPLGDNKLDVQQFTFNHAAHLATVAETGDRRYHFATIPPGKGYKATRFVDIKKVLYSVKPEKNIKRSTDRFAYHEIGDFSGTQPYAFTNNTAYRSNIGSKQTQYQPYWGWRAANGSVWSGVNLYDKTDGTYEIRDSNSPATMPHTTYINGSMSHSYGMAAQGVYLYLFMSTPDTAVQRWNYSLKCDYVVQVTKKRAVGQS